MTRPAFIGPALHDTTGCGMYECQCNDCSEMYEQEAAAECWAEGAWLRAAENAVPQHELDHELAMEANDAGLQALRQSQTDFVDFRDIAAGQARFA